ncbi:hypothetical protein D3C76_513550 [compost metagenome]
MAQIKLLQPGQPVADFAVNGTKITIAGVIVDAAELQSDSRELVEIRSNGNGAQVGGTGAYLAHIEIPPAQYAEAALGENGEQLAAPERLPLDPNVIVVTLWPTV